VPSVTEKQPSGVSKVTKVARKRLKFDFLIFSGLGGYGGLDTTGIGGMSALERHQHQQQQLVSWGLP